MKNLKVIISGGGTGGHIYPAIAVANALKEINSSIDILFVGAEGRMEMQKVPAAGYNIIGLPIMGIQRKITLKNLLFPFKLISSIYKAKNTIEAFGANIAVGFGGYASWPLLFAANLKGIPTIIQEQNGYAGLANKNLSSKAKAICVAYPGMESFFPKEKIIFTGNPVRKDIINSNNKRTEAIQHFGLNANKKTIAIIGGSLGAGTINNTIKENLKSFIDANVQLIWQTGKSYYAQCMQAAQGFEEFVKVSEFVYEMDLLYAASDIVISRAGALSISEIALAGKPCILVPSPNVTADHQTKNAMVLVSNNAAQLIKDEQASRVLVPAALKLILDQEKQDLFSTKIKLMAHADAANQIANIIIKHCL